MIGVTLPETNGLHLKLDGGRRSFFLGWPIFRGYVSFMEGNWDLTKFHLSPSTFNGCWLCWWIQFFQSPYRRSAVGYNMVGFTGLVLRKEIRMNWFAGSRWLSLSFEEASGSFILSYSWWKESCTIWDVNNGINYLPTGDRRISEPSTVCPDPKTSKKCWVLLRSSWASKEFVAAKGGLNSIFGRGGTLPVVVEVVGWCTNILEYHPWKLKRGTRKFTSRKIIWTKAPFLGTEAVSYRAVDPRKLTWQGKTNQLPCWLSGE